MDDRFFEKLVDFLPKHVSPIRSYYHGVFAFLVTFALTYYLGKQHFVMDFNQDKIASETEKRIQEGVSVAIAVIVSLLVADVAFSISWKKRNFAVNKNHMTYKRWFPGVYQP